MTTQTAKARTVHEIAFYVSLQECPQCGTRVDPWSLREYPFEGSYAVTGKCTKCQTALAYTFVTEGDALRGEITPGELGDARATQIIPVGAFLAEVDFLLPRIHEDPSQLGVDDWRANRDTNKRMLTCLLELLKFIPATGDTIPDDTLYAAERADKELRPERYSRTWLEQMRDRYLAVRQRNIADLPRIEALIAKEPRALATDAVGRLDPSELRDHED